MAVPPASERQGPTEHEPRNEGIRLRFVNPKLLRAYILDPNGPQPATLAERIAGISEVPLGQVLLDGNLFRAANFTLVVEPDIDPRGKHPTVIIRADLQLGEMDSQLKSFQFAKYVEPVNRQKHSLIQDVADAINIDDGKDGFIPWTDNTGRYVPRIKKTDPQKPTPLVLLQIWDKDVGFGSVSISLFSHGKYVTDRWDRKALHDAELESGFEVDPEELDRWRFLHPSVGIPVHEEANFVEQVAYYEDAFAELISALYAHEGVAFPNMILEIEPPLIFKEENTVTFADIGGLDPQKQFLQALAMQERNEQSQIEERAVFLHGPPGMGKTSLVEAFAAELQAPLVKKTSLDLPQGQLTEDDMMKFFESVHLEAKSIARRMGGKAVLVIEEIQAFLATARIQDFVLNKLEEWKRDREVVVMATSNNPSNIHPGIIDRFVSLEVKPPRKGAIKEILAIHIKKLAEAIGNPTIFTNVNLEKVADRMDRHRMSGREIVKFLSGAHSLRKLQLQKGNVVPDTDFLLSLLPDTRLGFKT